MKCEQGEHRADKCNLTALQEKLYIYLERHRESQLPPGREFVFRLSVAASNQCSLLTR